VFLQSHGIGTARAVRIYKTYGNQAIDKIRENPYCLASDIRGIGFKTADELAEKLGIPRDSILRARSGIHHVLQNLCEQGHCAIEKDKLIAASCELLAINEAIITSALDAELADKNLIADTIGAEICIFPINLYQAEVGSAQQLKQFKNGRLPWGEINIDDTFPWLEKITQLKLSVSQKEAIKIVLKNKLSIITGGPGVGKTTIVNSLLKVFLAKKLSVLLCAPTGRAAKRLTETTGLTAKTIHRLLEFNASNFSFNYNQDNPLTADVIIIDESSMLDISLLYHLVKAIPNRAAIIFVGDIDQLPSVGAGAVLADLIRSEKIATVRLTEIFRQAAESKIIINAHRINQGKMPLPNESSKSDFYTIYADTPEDIHAELIRLISIRIPQYYHCDPIKEIQLLTPMNRGSLGSRILNNELQAVLNKSMEEKIVRYGWAFAPGDKVIQNVNNYDKEIFNGDIGFIESINLEDTCLNINFDDRTVEYDFSELDEISLAYAISIHKSQGSEFPIIIIPLAMQHYTLLTRNLLYTAVTRAKKLVVLIGQKKAIAVAIHNNKQMQRLTKLAERL
jgi:exodeoxyribonuclease V alpha subunit